MSGTHTSLRVGIVASMALAIGGSIAFADDISNSIDSSIDVVAEVMPLNVGGANGTTTLYVQPTGGDGKSGCNLTGSTTLTVSVSSSNAIVATVSPSSVTFTGCGATPTLTVTPLQVGSTTISVSQTSNNTGGTFNFAPATFTVNVAPPPNTAPSVSIVGVTAATAYEYGLVPVATCQVTDVEDGNLSFFATLGTIIGPNANDGIGSQTASCSYTDTGGLSAVASVTYVIVDTTAPTVHVPANQTLEATGPGGASFSWTATADDTVDTAVTPTCDANSGDTFPLGETTVECSATDNAGNTGSASFTITVVDTTDPVVMVPADIIAEATGPNGAAVTFDDATALDLVDGALAATCDANSGDTFPLGETTVECSATDNAGNTGSASFTITVVDTTDPVVTVPADIIAEATGPNGAAVTFSASASDAVSGVLPVTCTVGTTDVASGNTFALGTRTVTCSATDAAGNIGSNSFTITVQDTTDPVVTVPADITAEATSAAGAAVSFVVSASDTVSGVLPVTCKVGAAVVASGDTFPLGTTTVTCSATDAAGNTGSNSFTISVQLELSGFYQPVDMGTDVVNTVKSGSTVPLKFEVFAGTTELTNTSIVKTFTYALTSCANFVGGTEDAIETVTSGNTVLRYDTSGGQFVQNWQTPKNSAGKCYRVTMTTQDGSSIVANFKLK